VRLTYAHAYRDGDHTLAESAFKEPAGEHSSGSVEPLKPSLG